MSGADDADGWRALAAGDLDAAFAFLAEAPLVNMPMLDMLSVMRAHGLDLGTFGWFGRRQAGMWTAIATSAGCLWAHAPDPAYHAEVAMLFDELRLDTPWMQVAEPLGAALLAVLAAPASDRQHLVMTLDPADLVAVAPDPAMRLATEADLATVIANEAAMLREESGYDPLAEDAAGFTAVIGRRVRDGRVYVLEEGGRIGYQIGLGYLVPELGLGEFVNAYVPADLRGRGYARRGLPQACRLAFGLCRRLIVTPRPDHPVVIALNTSVGFRTDPARLREATWAED